MAETGLEPDLLRFIETQIASVEHLEVLLLVSSSPGHWWPVRAVNDVLRSSEESIHKRMAELARAGLLDKEPSGEGYRLTDNPGFQKFVERLKIAYKNYRVRVIETIYAPKSSPISEFSRAFDFRQRKE